MYAHNLRREKQSGRNMELQFYFAQPAFPLFLCLVSGRGEDKQKNGSVSGELDHK